MTDGGKRGKMARMEQVSLMELGKLAAEGQVEAEVFAQIAQCAQKMTKSNKPYLDVSFADAEGTMGLKGGRTSPGSARWPPCLSAVS